MTGIARRMGTSFASCMRCTVYRILAPVKCPEPGECVPIRADREQDTGRVSAGLDSRFRKRLTAAGRPANIGDQRDAEGNVATTDQAPTFATGDVGTEL